MWWRRTVCRPAATEGGVAVSKTQAIEPTGTCDRRDHWFPCLCLRWRRALLIRGAPARDRQRRPDDRSGDERNPSFSHAGPASSACSMNAISARCPRFSMSAIADCNRPADPGIEECGPIPSIAPGCPPHSGLARRTANYFARGRKNSPSRPRSTVRRHDLIQSTWGNPRTLLLVLTGLSLTTTARPPR